MAPSRKPVTALAKAAVFFVASAKGGKTSAKGDKKTAVTADSHVPPPYSKSPSTSYSYGKRQNEMRKEAKQGSWKTVYA
jgi:hypothetical protein